MQGRDVPPQGPAVLEKPACLASSYLTTPKSTMDMDLYKNARSHLSHNLTRLAGMRALLLAFFVVLLAACAHAPRNPMAQWVPSANFNARRPTLIVVHYTEQD